MIRNDHVNIIGPSRVETRSVGRARTMNEMNLTLIEVRLVESGW